MIRNFVRVHLPKLGIASKVSAQNSIRTLATAPFLEPKQHPWLAQVEAPSSFLPEERILTFLASNVAAGNLKNVERDWLHLPPDLQGKGLEIILQAQLLAGFPRTLNALMRIHELGLYAAEGSKHYEEKRDLFKWRNDGREMLHAVYGEVTDKMQASFRKIHPLLESILTEHIYGRVLSRPLVGRRMRELCSLSIIAGQNLPLQLVSHLRGAIRCGASRDEVVTVIDQTGLSWGPQALAQAIHVRDVRWPAGHTIPDA